MPEFVIDQNAEPPASAWVRAHIGEDYFRTVIAVYFNHPNPNISTFDFEQLAKLPGLIHFVLESRGGWRANDSDLAVLGKLNRLESLQLQGARINGTVLALLDNPARLTNVSLSQTDIDDVAMEYVGRMINVDRIWLDGTRITDTGLVHLEKLGRLKLLYLQGTKISDAGIQHLAAAVAQLADHERDVDRLAGRMQPQHRFVNGAISFVLEIGRFQRRGHLGDAAGIQQHAHEHSTFGIDVVRLAVVQQFATMSAEAVGAIHACDHSLRFAILDDWQLKGSRAEKPRASRSFEMGPPPLQKCWR